MARFDENYFLSPDNETRLQNIDEILSDDERLLWKGKPKKSAYVLNAFMHMLPFALIWLVVDVGFIIMLTQIGAELPTFAIIILCVFFAFHLLPVWIWISNVITANKAHKNLEYAFTDKRIIVKSGIIGIDFKNVYYNEISSVNLRVGLVDKMMKVGDIYIKGLGNATVLYDLENPYFITQKIQKIISDIKNDSLK